MKNDWSSVNDSWSWVESTRAFILILSPRLGAFENSHSKKWGKKRNMIIRMRAIYLPMWLKKLGTKGPFILESLNSKKLFSELWISAKIRRKRICYKDLKVIIFHTWLFGSARHRTTMGMRCSESTTGKSDLFSCRKMAIGGICSSSSARTVGSAAIKKWDKELYKNKPSILYSIYW